ncbi:MAG: class I SAM-dependent methyltransferase [Rhodobacteraceae bacterium]|nr:class I SAM-dependent methyltransferase [Paracoccaceae bacterium]
MAVRSEAAVMAEDTEFVRFWNDVLGPKFIRFKHVLVDGLSRHSAACLPKLPVRRGDAALDVGCGFGDTAIELARMVGPEGHVLGMDCVDAFMEFGRADARCDGLTNLEFRRGDAEIALPRGEFDFVFSRFGTMFFTHTVPALRNMRLALKPGGRMAHIVWRQREDNPAWMKAKEVMLRFLPEPGEDAATCGPGPFSMADPEKVTAQMRAAGYGEIAFERVDTRINMGRDVRDAIDFQLALGPAGEVFRVAGALAEQRRPEIEAALAEMYAAEEQAEDGIWMNSSSWVITARNPG